MDILDQPALEISAALARKDLSALELMMATLARIDAVNGPLNAIVSLRDRDALLTEARVADKSPRKGWLHGMPMAVKDLANVAGLRTTMGSPLFAANMAAKDDLFVARMRVAGAIFIGKTNTPEFGLGSHTFNPVHGVTPNPYDHEKSCGGSSGGAAAALATRMLSIADGSDMMGSLRNPAGWNNVYGLRPTWGTVPSEPVGDIFMHQLSTNGPMARNPHDLAALLDTLAGEDHRQPFTRSTEAVLPRLDDKLGQLRIGWPGDWGGAYHYEAGIAEISEAALRKMGELGHAVETLPPPFAAEALWESWCRLRSFAIAASLGPFLADPKKQQRLKTTAIWEIEQGQSLTAQDIQRASHLRSDWFRRAGRLFEQIDVLALPSAQVWPFEIDLEYPTEIAGRIMPTYHAWMQAMIPAALIGLPVVNIPIGFGEAGLPAGLQLIGPRGSEARLLQLAVQWHEATNWPDRKP